MSELHSHIEVHKPSERGTGRTTAIVLAAIAQALYARGCPVSVTDHFHEDSDYSHFRRMATTIQAAVTSLGLGGFTVRQRLDRRAVEVSCRN